MPTVIVKYEAGYNGKFIINCLSLSAGAILQHKDLTKRTPQGKLNALLHRLAAETTEHGWQDLNMGCYQLFKVNAMRPLSKKGYTEIPQVTEANEKGLYSFIIAHNDQQLQNLYPYFEHCQIIELEKPHLWLYDQNAMLAYVKGLYDQLGLTDFDEEKILVYYNAYVEKLKEFNRWQPPKYH